MKNSNTQVLQKSLSRTFQGSLTQTLVEGLFLFAAGFLAMFLHARLKMPMHLPGKQGLLFMFIVIGTSLMSKFRFSTLITTAGASVLILSGFGGFDDPFMAVHYLLLGFVMDLIISSSSNLSSKAWFIGIAGGLSFSVIPLSRAIFSLFTGLPYPSLFNGLVFPWFTHFLFGFAGSFLAALAVNTLATKEGAGN